MLPDASIIVRKHERRVEFYSAGNLARVAQCCIGMKGFRTPKGRWRLGSRSRTPDWLAPAWAGPLAGTVLPFGHPLNPYRAGLIQLVGADQRTAAKTGYAMHGTSNPGSIPGVGSHGCIRLHDDDVLWMYDRMPEGTPVEIR